MKIIEIAMLMIALLLPAVDVQAAPSNGPYDPRAVLGAVGTYLPLVAQSKHDQWEVIKVVTDQFSGADYENGSVTVSGSYAVIHPLGEKTTSLAGRYSWSKPVEINRLSLSYHSDPQLTHWVESGLFEHGSDGKLPQSATRYLLCVLHEKATGQDKFTEVHLVPDAWQNNVLPAVEYLRIHPKLSDLNDAAPNLVQTRALLRNPNPYLVLTAIQLLAIHKDLTTADMEAAFSSKDVGVIAGSLAIAQFYAWTASKANTQWLTNQVLNVSSMNQLAGVAVGIYAGSFWGLLFAPNPTGDLPKLPDAINPSLGKNSLAANLTPILRQKLKELDPHGGPEDASWRAVDSVCLLTRT